MSNPYTDFDYNFLICNDIKYFDSSSDALQSLYPICSFVSSESLLINNIILLAWKKQDPSLTEDYIFSFEIIDHFIEKMEDLPSDSSSKYNHMQILKIYRAEYPTNSSYYKPFFKDNKKICVFIHHDLNQIVCVKV